MSQPNQEFKCTCVFRVNYHGGTDQWVYFIPATDERTARLEAKSQFMKDHEAQLSGSAWVFLSVTAETDNQMMLL